jgi:drug/metabolite transporter (DMT)-like permease
MNLISRETVGFVCVILTAIGWGLNWPATKFLLATCPPLSSRGVSGLAAGVMLLGVAAVRGEALRVPRRLWGRLALGALLNVSVWMGFTTASLLWLPAGQAATLAYTMPIWVVLLAWPLLGERPTVRQIGSVVLGFCGVIILVNGGAVSAAIPGIALALSAAGLFAFSTVRAKRAPIPLPPTALTGWQVTLGCIPLLVAGLSFEHPRFDAMPPIGWAALAYSTCISMGLCYILWFAAVARLKASSAAIGILLTPVIGVTASSWVLGEPLPLSAIGALGLVVAGIVLAAKGDAKVPPLETHAQVSGAISSRASL